MNIKFSVFSILMSLAVSACTRSDDRGDQSEIAITLTPLFESSARATSTAFTEGDQIGLYLLRKVDNALFSVGADGVITSSPALYYPDPKLPVAFRAYYPYNSSVTDATKIPFSVTTDLKQSDLCYAQAEALPNKEAQALPFKHWLSRVAVNITLNSKVKSIKSVKLLNTAIDLTFNIETGAIAVGAPTKSLLVNNSEAIVPPQTFAAGTKMLEITVETVAGATETYYYAPLSAMTLAQGKSHSFSLTLNDNKSAELTAAPKISPWTGGASTGIVDQKVSNRLILHWVSGHSRAAEVNKITLTLKDNNGKITQHTIDNPTYSNSSFSFDFAPAVVTYPYTITKIDFHLSTNILQSCVDLLAASVYKSGDHAVGVKDIGNAVKIGNLWWATGNLVATNTTAPNNAGLGGARIGSPTDGGLYFKFGSLIGLKGGANGSGVGAPILPHNTGYWLRPEGHTASTNWATAAYFSAANARGDLRDYVTTDNAANKGIGDACRYYLGSPWRTPTGREYGDLCNKKYAISSNVGWAATGGKEVTTPLYGGWWNGTSSSTTDPLTAVYFVGSGYRSADIGALKDVGSLGRYWSSSIGSATYGLFLDFYAGCVYPQISELRVRGFTLRCVQ